MRIKKKDKPYNFLNNAFNILCVDDEPKINEIYAEFLGNIQLFSIETVISAREAVEKLTSDNFHVCLLDIIGIDDIEGGAYYLLEKFGEKIPVIIVSQCSSIEEGEKSVRYGAFKNIDKYKGIKNLDHMIKHIEEAILFHFFCQQPDRRKKEDNKAAFDALLEYKPETVTEWAGFLQWNDNDLRRLFYRHPLKLKDILKVFHIISDSFKCCGCMDELCIKEENCTCPVYKRYKKLKKYYYCNMTSINEYLKINSGS